MRDCQSNVCPICHQESLYEGCSWGEKWVAGCDECGIETEPQDTEEEALLEWDRMMRERITLII